MALTVQMIENKEFSVVPMGYKRKEVDEFLDEICDEMDRLHDEIGQLQQRVSKAGQTQVFKPQARPGAVPAPAAAAPAYVPAPIEVVEEEEEAQEPEPQPAPKRQPAPAPARAAQKEEPAAPAKAAPAAAPSVTVDAANILLKAQTVYDQTVAEAQKLYDEKVQGAKDEAEKIIREAREAMVSQNRQLTEEKEALEKAIKTLRTSAGDYRARLQALLTGQQKTLDEASELFED